METRYLNRLPDDVRALVATIEEYCGVEISVTVDPSRSCRIPNEPDPLACEVAKDGAQILIPTAEVFPNASVLHELLHIRRFLLDGVPRIVICDDYDDWTPQRQTALIGLDNSLEHLLIVPEELQFRPKRKEYWGRVIHRALNRLALENLPLIDRERYILINWVFLQHVLPGSDLNSQASALIEKLGINDRAARMADALLPALNFKESAVRICFEHLQLPLDIGCLEYIDIRNQSSHEIHIRAVQV